MSAPRFAELAAIPRDAEGPVFAEPWEAQAFALTMRLHAQGVFTWTEWASALAAEIRRAQSEGDADLGDTYYRHWLAALEQLLATKQIVPRAALSERAAAVAHAAGHDHDDDHDHPHHPAQGRES